jgi:release factor glutamine methyltransferase
MTQWILEKVCNLSRHQQIWHKDKQLSQTEQQSIETIVQRLKNSEPIQYILGETEFYGLTFEVTPAVLIPRPETEELVNTIIRDSKFMIPQSSQGFTLGRIQNTKFHNPVRDLMCVEGSKFKILDIGTGSGCIAVSLAKKLTNAHVYALDISAEALQIAQRNAQRNDVVIEFFQADILTENIQKGVSKNVPRHAELDSASPCFDLIVSNPPYVTMREKTAMKSNVLDYEPHNALFVPDDNPLLFYRRIADIGLNKLETNGLLYFEINALFGEQICRLLHQKGYRHIELSRDLSGKERFIKAMK